MEHPEKIMMQLDMGPIDTTSLFLMYVFLIIISPREGNVHPSTIAITKNNNLQDARTRGLSWC